MFLNFFCLFTSFHYCDLYFIRGFLRLHIFHFNQTESFLPRSKMNFQKRWQAIVILKSRFRSYCNLKKKNHCLKCKYFFYLELLSHAIKIHSTARKGMGPFSYALVTQPTLKNIQTFFTFFTRLHRIYLPHSYPTRCIHYWEQHFDGILISFNFLFQLKCDYFLTYKW